MSRKLLLAATLALAGCTSHPAPPQDDAMEVAISAGRQAMDNHQPAQAIPRFTDAHHRALLRDDASAIGDTGYDLAAAQLAADHPDAALATLTRTRDELMPRGIRDLPILDLVEAAALDRLGRTQQAAVTASRAATSPDPDTAARATYLAGRIAARAGDLPTLDAADRRLAAMAPPKPKPGFPDWRLADLRELDARTDLARHDFTPARSTALAAADLRRTGLDYAGMRTALRLAAQASDGLGNTTEAAAYRQQAAQSEAAVDRP